MTIRVDDIEQQASGALARHPSTDAAEAHMSVSIELGSAAFPALPSVIRLVVATVVAGTVAPIDQTSTPVPISLFQAERPESRAESYARLKTEIVAAGVPLLDDESLREEIRQRRGIRE